IASSVNLLAMSGPPHPAILPDPSTPVPARRRSNICLDGRRSLYGMSGALQGSLLDLGDDVRPGRFGSSVERTVLTRGAWVAVRRGGTSGADVLFAGLVVAVPWRAERRQMYEREVDVPRLLCFYDEHEPLPDPVLVDARHALDRHYGPELGERF